MLFEDLINEMPKSSDHKDIFRVFGDKSVGPSKYLEDTPEEEMKYRDAREMVDVLTTKMMANPLMVDRLKVKIDILTSISDHPKYWDSNGKPLFYINNSLLLYSHDEYICFNDKRRNYPIMYIDKNFLEMDSVGNFRWLVTPTEMRDYFQKILALRNNSSSMSFIRPVGPECEAMTDINMFQFKASVVCLLPMTRDFLDFNDHIIFNSKKDIMSKFYKMITLFIDYMFDVYDKESQYIGSDLYHDKDRYSVVLAGYGAVGIKNCCFTSAQFFCANMCELKRTDKRFFESFFLNEIVRQDLNLNTMLEEAYAQIMGPQHLVPNYGIVRVAENYSVVEDCDICAEHHANLLDPHLLQGRELPGTGDYELKYGILTTVARNRDDALKCISTYMLDCPYITDVKISDDIISVDKNGREISKSRINNKRMSLQNIYKKRRRVFDFSCIEKADRDDGLGQYIIPSTFRSVQVHDEFGRKLVNNSTKLFDESFMESDPTFTSCTEEYDSDSLSCDDPNCESSSIKTSDPLDTEELKTMLNLVDSSDRVVPYDVQSMSDSTSSLSLQDYNVDVPLKDLRIERDHVYWYAISFKRMIYDIGVSCGLSEEMLNIMVKGGYVPFSILPLDCLVKLRNYKLFQQRGNKLSISASYSVQVDCILRLFEKGIIKLKKRNGGGYIWEMINDSRDCLEILSF